MMAATRAARSDQRLVGLMVDLRADLSVANLVEHSVGLRAASLAVPWGHLLVARKAVSWAHLTAVKTAWRLVGPMAGWLAAKSALLTAVHWAVCSVDYWVV